MKTTLSQVRQRQEAQRKGALQCTWARVARIESSMVNEELVVIRALQLGCRRRFVEDDKCMWKGLRDFVELVR